MQLNRTDNNDGKNGGGGAVGGGKQLQKGPRPQRWEEAWVWVSEEGKVQGPVTTPSERAKTFGMRL